MKDCGYFKSSIEARVRSGTWRERDLGLESRWVETPRDGVKRCDAILFTPTGLNSGIESGALDSHNVVEKTTFTPCGERKYPPSISIPYDWRTNAASCVTGGLYPS